MVIDEEISEIAAPVLVVVAALWAVAAKLWRVPHVINRIVESNLLDKLEVWLAENDVALKTNNEHLGAKRAG